tara:strand:+ start:11249 stop:12529 length:1281 start_codon:yes stop_codon:yes gene_type:complete
MAWWALFSAMFWLYIAVACANLVGITDTLIGMALTIAVYGIFNAFLSKFGAKTGLTVELFSRSLFGIVGSALATLIFAATAIYYIVFEGSIIAVAFQQFFGGDINLWYLAVVIYIIPLVIGGIRNWLDRLNGVLLPIYFLGLVAAVVVTAVTHPGEQIAWPTAPAGGGGALPGWATTFLIYMGVWIMMMYTFDYARLGKKEDQKFHSTFTFGWVFYLFTFAFNGVIGIYLTTVWQTAGTETGVVNAIIQSLGIVGLLVIVVSQTRINTASYYLSSTNLDAFATRVFRLALPRWVWVLVTSAIAYAVMLTNVLSWILVALAWQGVFVVAWAAIALVYILNHRRRTSDLPEVRRDHLSAVAPGALVWLLASGIGIWLTEQDAVPVLAQLAPVITFVLAGGGFLLTSKFWPPRVLDVAEDVHVDEQAMA